ncbi:MAG: transcription termination factor NusA [Simkaniaceae bacterium]|nr:transcription termination factor NusA [Simkaniaceae bacterium]MCF7852921.1 transcription termination factor NusA [Simkaniaceae bacterium]
MNKDLVAIFEYLEREKGIKRDVVINAIEDSLRIAAKKSIHNVGNVSVQINPKTGEIETLVEKEIVDHVEYPDEEITLEHAREIDPDCVAGQWIQVNVTPRDFGRIAAQVARQVITQKLKVAERDVIYEEYRHRISELISGTVKRKTRGGTLIIDLGKVEAIMPDRFYPREENFHIGDRVLALLLEVRDTENGGAEVILSRSHPQFVEQLFAQEVPEIHDNTILIKRIVRDAGYRTKMSVSTTDLKIDPVGACVGVRGGRVKNIIRELNNEKIDIIPHSDDPIVLLKNAVAPVILRKIEVDEENQRIVVVVSDEDYPIVLGRKGINARLTGDLIECELKVYKMSDYEKEAHILLQKLATSDDPVLDESLHLEHANQLAIDSLIAAGFDTPRKVLSHTPHHLAKEAGLSLDLIEDIIEQIKKERI